MAYELNNGYARPPDWWIQQTGLCRANSIFAKNKYLFLQKDEIQLWIDSQQVSAVAQPLIVFKVSCSHKNSKTDNKNEHELLSCHEMQQNRTNWTCDCYTQPFLGSAWAQCSAALAASQAKDSSIQATKRLWSSVSEVLRRGERVPRGGKLDSNTSRESKRK